MKYNPSKDHRRSLRLRDYDYTQAGAYFVTIVAQGRRCLFGTIEREETRLNKAGRMVHAVWSELPVYYPGIETDVFVVMPNHFHGIIDLVGATPRGCPPPADAHSPTRTAISLPDVLHRFKTLTTKKYTDGVKRLGWPRFVDRLWQRNYYEHVIRNDESLNRIREYIINNPARWSFDPENPTATTPEPKDAWLVQEGDRPIDYAQDRPVASTS